MSAAESTTFGVRVRPARPWRLADAPAPDRILSVEQCRALDERVRGPARPGSQPPPERPGEADQARGRGGA